MTPRIAFSQDGGAWPRWRDRFLSDDGRVIDDENGRISHSEGQGFGALLAQAHGDREAFELIEGWTRGNLLVRQDRLMGWRWNAATGVADEDWHNATDGDLFRAWALLRAERDSGWPVNAGLYQDIARDIVSLCLRPDPRAPGSLLLTPGAEARSDPDRVLFNPSYIMPRALRELGLATERPELLAAADHGETVLAELAALHPLPDWIDVTATGFATPAEHALRSGYDALRVPLYLSWSGRRSHPAVMRGMETLMSASLPGHLAVNVTLEGKVLAQSDQPGYRAIVDLAQCREVKISAEQMDRQSYYPATLGLLAQIARADAGDCMPK